MTGRTDPDVLVIGGGPSGSTVGGLLAGAGYDVLLVDRAGFPRAKPCGECVNPGAVSLLADLGLLGSVMALRPARLSGWDLHTSGGRRAAGNFALRSPGGGNASSIGLGIARERLDDALLRACRNRGVDVWTGVSVENVTPGGSGRRPQVQARDWSGARRLWRPRLVVGADGLRSVVARRVGVVRRRARPRKVSLTCHVRPPPSRWTVDRGSLFICQDGTVGLAPLTEGGEIWNATVVLDPAVYGRSLASAPLAVFRKRVEGTVPPWTGFDVVGGPWASGPFNRPVTRASTEGVLLVGDAAGYYDPLTGQGIYRALRSARLAAAAGLALLTGERGAEAEYDARVRAAFSAPRRLQRVVERVVSGRLLDPGVGLLGSRPSLADVLVQVTGDLRPVRALAQPGLWLGAGSPPRG